MLNASANYGPMLGNSLGTISLFYNLIHGASVYARKGKEDTAGAGTSAFLAGFIFKAGSGIKLASATGAVTSLGILAFRAAHSKLWKGSTSEGPFLQAQ